MQKPATLIDKLTTITLFQVKNRFKGVQPEFSGWDTPPSSPENVTDEDWSSVTGTGQTKVGAGGGFVGFMDFDMGAVRTVQIFIKVGLWGSISGQNHELDISWSNNPDVDGWFSASFYNIVVETLTTEQVHMSHVQHVRARHVRFRFWYYGSNGTGYAKIYEAMALEFPQVAGANP